MSKWIAGTALILALCGSALATPQEGYGWVEKGLILPTGVAVKMKLDTGARTSSMDAQDLEQFTRDGKPWVRFWLRVTDADSGKQVSRQFERPVERHVTVRGAGGKEKQKRPVVTMSVCVGSRVYEGWFTLRDRSKMIYPVLLGRRMLEEMGPVDAGRTFTRQPDCR
ncbi:retropepsin-like aspartic peptidase RloA3 [Aeromonas enteropelogenes]|uniref:retropepsin-like aspartic peptidase RloA3 n=1 Tax=Aeromonas enteropelogenes TaxID=29489 RepID=UPI003F74408E